MLRGAFLRNTEYIIGIVIYTGHDTKIMMNTAKSRFKVTLMEENMNRLILLLLVLQFALIVCSIVGYVLWNNLYLDKFKFFLPKQFSIGAEAVLSFFSYFLIYNTLLPISLMVTIDIAKLVQTYFISEDVEFYNAEKEKGCRVMTKSINEELGQIEYVFTDKTGTLTCNVMVLQYLVIGGTVYTGKLEKKGPEHSVFAQERDFYSGPLMEVLRKGASNTDFIYEPFPGYTISGQHHLAQEYLTLLGVCHDCVVHMQNQNEREVIRYATNLTQLHRNFA